LGLVDPFTDEQRCDQVVDAYVHVRDEVTKCCGSTEASRSHARSVG
jgi:hypothetical protein